MADEDTSDVMTQPWESGIEDLLVADPSNDSDDTLVSEQNEDVIGNEVFEMFLVLIDCIKL